MFISILINGKNDLSIVEISIFFTTDVPKTNNNYRIVLNYYTDDIDIFSIFITTLVRYLKYYNLGNIVYHRRVQTEIRL